MPTTAPPAEKRTRTRAPSVKITAEIVSKLDKLAVSTAEQMAAAGGIKLKPSHAQLIEAMLDSALDTSTNGAS